MLLERPYFMENKEWYWLDEKANDDFSYKLTDKATERAKKSYIEFYTTLNSWGLGYPVEFSMSMKDVEAGIAKYKKLVAEGKLPPQDD